MFIHFTPIQSDFGPTGRLVRKNVELEVETRLSEVEFSEACSWKKSCGFVSCTACLFGVAYFDTFGLCGVINAHVSLSASSTLQEKEQKKEAPLLLLFSVCHFGLRHALMVVMV